MVTIRDQVEQHIQTMTNDQSFDSAIVGRINAAKNQIITDLENTRSQLEQWGQLPPVGQPVPAGHPWTNTWSGDFNAMTQNLFTAPETATAQIHRNNQILLFTLDPETDLGKRIEGQLDQLQAERIGAIAPTLDTTQQTAATQAIKQKISSFKDQYFTLDTKMAAALALAKGDPAQQTALESEQNTARRDILQEIFNTRIDGKDGNSVQAKIAEMDRNLFPPPERPDFDVYEAGDRLGESIGMTEKMRMAAGSGTDFIKGTLKSAWNDVAVPGYDAFTTPSTGKNAHAWDFLKSAGAGLLVAGILNRLVFSRLEGPGFFGGLGTMASLGLTAAALVYGYMIMQGYLQGKGAHAADDVLNPDQDQDAVLADLPEGEDLAPFPSQEPPPLTLFQQDHAGGDVEVAIGNTASQDEENIIRFPAPEDMQAVGGSGAYVPNDVLPDEKDLRVVGFDDDIEPRILPYRSLQPDVAPDNSLLAFTA